MSNYKDDGLIAIAIVSVIFLTIVHLTHPIAGYSADQWCDAIKHEEGATYGVGNYNNQKQVCINTVRHKFKDWRSGSRDDKALPFITYLSIKYCPLNHASWAHNVQYWLNKGE